MENQQSNCMRMEAEVMGRKKILEKVSQELSDNFFRELLKSF